MLFVVCSGSAFARDINGYNVESYYNVNNNGTGTQFTTTIKTTSAPSTLYIVVDAVVNIDKGDIFNTVLKITPNEAESIELYSTELFNTSWNRIDSVYGSFDGSSVYIEDITAPRNLKAIRYTFVVTNPVYTKKDDTPTDTGFYFYLDGKKYTYSSSMTWNNYCSNSATSWPLQVVTDEDNIEYLAINVDGEWYYVKNPSGNFTKGSDTIIKGGSYKTSYAMFGITYEYNFAIDSFSAEVVDEGGLLSNIIGWVKKIADSVTELPSKIVEGIGQKLTQLKDGLLEGIKNLFIPNEEQVLDLRNRFEELLASRFGAVYESSEIIDDFANAFQQEASISTPSNLSGTTSTSQPPKVKGTPDKLTVTVGKEILLPLSAVDIDASCWNAFAKSSIISDDS